MHLEARRDNRGLRDRALGAALAEPPVREAHDNEHGGGASVSLHLKLAPDVAIADAHDVAERVEAALRAQPDVDDVHTHLEPLEQPVAVRPEEGGESDAAEERRIAGLVADCTGRPPRQLRLLRAAGGLVVFVSVAVPAEMSLPDAHELASRLEDVIRDGRPHMHDVVVHTEP